MLKEYNYSDVSDTCWSEGDIDGVTFTEKNGVFTVAECQHQCDEENKCIHFSFNEENNTCKAYKENVTQHFLPNDPLLFGPKECPRKFNATK